MTENEGRMKPVLNAEERDELKEILDQLTELEKNFAQILVYQRPRTNREALERAGSNAKGVNLTKLASEMQKRPHVAKYIEHLRKILAEDQGLHIAEIIRNARKGIEMAFSLGKPRDAEPHNRLLAELGGFIKNNPTVNNQTLVKVEDNSGLKGDTLEQDLKRFRAIVGNTTNDEEE